MKERLLAGLFGLLLSNAGAAADFLVEVRVLVQRGCMGCLTPIRIHSGLWDYARTRSVAPLCAFRSYDA